jgi:hypothetical protein
VRFGRDGRLGLLVEKGVADEGEGELRSYRRLAGSVVSYRERVYSVSAVGRALLDRTAGEPPPAPPPLTAAHLDLLTALRALERGTRGQCWTAAVIDARAHGSAAADRQAARARVTGTGVRLGTLAARGLVAAHDGDDLYAARRWSLTEDGLRALTNAGR